MSLHENRTVVHVVEGLHPSPNGDKRVSRDGPVPPPLGVTLTWYRLLTATVIILWGVPKLILSYENRSIAATTLDLLTAPFAVL